MWNVTFGSETIYFNMKKISYILLLMFVLHNMNGQITIAKKLILNGNVLTEATTGDTVATLEWVNDTIQYYVKHGTDTLSIADSIQLNGVWYTAISGNVTSAVPQDLANQTDNGVLRKSPSDSIISSSALILHDSLLYANLIDISTGNNAELYMNPGVGSVALNISDGVHDRSMTLHSSGLIEFETGGSSDMVMRMDTNLLTIINNTTTDSIARFSNLGVKLFRNLTVDGTTTTGNPRFYASCADSSYEIVITQNVDSVLIRPNLLTVSRNEGTFVVQGDSVQVPFTGWGISDLRVNYQGTAVASAFDGRFSVNGTMVENKGELKRSTTTNAIGSSSMYMEYQFTAGDWIKPLITNTSGSNNITIISVDWTIKWDE